MFLIQPLGCNIINNVELSWLASSSSLLCVCICVHAAGIAGLQWKRHFGQSVSVTLNDNSADNHAEILNHVKLNDMLATDADISSSDQEVQVTRHDANIILHQRQFHFVYVIHRDRK